MRELRIGIDKIRNVGTVSFDLEWTKNFRKKNESRPFCFSFVFLPKDFDVSVTDARRIRFGVWAFYIDSQDEGKELVRAANMIWGKIIKGASGPIVVGHQISSDFAVLMNYACQAPKSHIALARSAWRQRKESTSTTSVLDTRYDGECFFTGDSRRLVDVCNESNLLVTQPELQSSMTAMQYKYYSTGDYHIRERLQILNVRHSLSSAVLAHVIRSGIRRKIPLNLNNAIHEQLASSISYLSSEQFQSTLT